MLVHLDIRGAKGLKELRRAFASVLKDHDIDIAATERIEADTGDGYFNPVGWSYPIETLMDIVARHPDVDAVVSLAGGPSLSDDQDVTVPEHFPDLVVAFSPGAPPMVEALFDRELLAMAIVPRLSGRNQPKPATPRERFDAEFVVVTHESDEIPVPLLPPG